MTKPHIKTRPYHIIIDKPPLTPEQVEATVNKFQANHDELTITGISTRTPLGVEQINGWPCNTDPDRSLSYDSYIRIYVETVVVEVEG